MATFPIARLYYSPPLLLPLPSPFLFPRHSAAQDSGWSPDVLPKAVCGYLTFKQLSTMYETELSAVWPARTPSLNEQREGGQKSRCPPNVGAVGSRKVHPKEHLKTFSNQNEESLK